MSSTPPTSRPTSRARHRALSEPRLRQEDSLYGILLNGVLSHSLSDLKLDKDSAEISEVTTTLPEQTSSEGKVSGDLSDPEGDRISTLSYQEGDVSDDPPYAEPLGNINLGNFEQNNNADLLSYSEVQNSADPEYCEPISTTEHEYCDLDTSADLIYSEVVMGSASQSPEGNVQEHIQRLVQTPIIPVHGTGTHHLEKEGKNEETGRLTKWYVPPPILPQLTALVIEGRVGPDKAAAYQPRSVLSCPESPLYESLATRESDPSDEGRLTDSSSEDHYYQQIPPLRTLTRATSEPHIWKENQDSIGPLLPQGKRHHKNNNTRHTGPQWQLHQPGHPKRLNTLDIKPERKSSQGNQMDWDTESDTYQSVEKMPLSSDRVSSVVSSSVDRDALHENQRSATYITNSDFSFSGQDISRVLELNLSQDMGQSSSVIHGIDKKNSRDEGKGQNTNISDERGREKVGIKAYQEEEEGSVVTQGMRFPSVPNNSPNDFTFYNGSRDTPTNDREIIVLTQPSRTVPLPLTIELSETRESSFYHEQHFSPNYTHRTLYPMQTLDPPIMSSKHMSQTYGHVTPDDNNITTSDEESFDTDKELPSDRSRFWWSNRESTMSGNSTVESQTSLYSSAGLYSASREFFMYALPHPPNSSNHGPSQQSWSSSSTLDYRPQSYLQPRNNSSRVYDHRGYDHRVTREGVVPLNEPTYRPCNLFVGSRGHLHFDYSWSWNCLNNFISTSFPGRCLAPHT